MAKKHEIEELVRQLKVPGSMDDASRKRALADLLLRSCLTFLDCAGFEPRLDPRVGLSQPSYIEQNNWELEPLPPMDEGQALLTQAYRQHLSLLALIRNYFCIPT